MLPQSLRLFPGVVLAAMLALVAGPSPAGAQTSPHFAPAPTDATPAPGSISTPAIRDVFRSTAEPRSESGAAPWPVLCGAIWRP